jgi:hypothetical protein
MKLNPRAGVITAGEANWSLQVMIVITVSQETLVEPELR